MSYTTAHTDGSGENLIEEIRELHSDLGALTRRHEALVDRLANLAPIPEFPASDLLSIGTGPARVAIFSNTNQALFQMHINEFLAEVEGEGSIVESVQFQPSQFSMASGAVYGALVLYRLPTTETEVANG